MKRFASGMRLAALGIAGLAFAVRAAPVQAQCQANQQAKLTSDDAAAGDVFGTSVSNAADMIVVGANGDDDAGSNSGSVYTFVRDGTGWTQQAKLTADDANAGDFFGRSVSIDGEILVVGASRSDDAGSDSGSTYVFFRSDRTWMQQARLTADDAAAGDELGISVSIDGDTAVAGAWLDDDACPGNSSCNSGSAYVFVRTGLSWTQQAKLTPDDAALGDRFGWSVSIDGDTALVGAVFDDDAGSQSGSAYVFVRTDGRWAQEAKLVADDAAFADEFGVSVSIDGDTAVVGARFNDDAGNASGSAYVFVRSGASWSQQAKLTAEDAAGGDVFGVSVAIAGDKVAVGALGDDVGGFVSGSVYVFVRTGAIWTQVAKLTADDASAFDRLGASASIAGGLVVAGADRDDDAGDDSGSAYVFDGLADCNNNTTLDLCDIADGSSVDENDDGVPDECEVSPVFVDIKPGGCPNSFNLNSNGVLPVAVLGAAGFDAAMIDVGSILLSRADGVGGQVAPHEGPPGPHSTFEDIATPFEGETCDCHDLDGDGIVDLSLKFKTDDVVEVLEMDDLPAGALVELVVSGSLLEGTPFSGSDCIRLVPPGTPSALLSVTSNVTGAWVGVTPLDNTLDGGGFTNFVRNFPETTVVTLSAETFVNNKPLVGWIVAGEMIAVDSGAPWLATSALKHTLIAGEAASIQVVYGPPTKKPAPKPGPVMGPTQPKGLGIDGIGGKKGSLPVE